MPKSLDEEILRAIRLVANITDAFTSALFLIRKEENNTLIFRLKAFQSLSTHIIANTEFPIECSRYGIVVISKHFLAKEWPRRELAGMFAKEVAGQKVILPVWHNISEEEVRRHSPMLADKVATNSSKGISAVVSELLKAIG